MRILVCGGRDYTDKAQLFEVLDRHKPAFIISGAARGADSLAVDYARVRGMPFQEYPANWNLHGNSAGPIRNKQMLDEGQPEKIIAFPGGKGTANMITQSKKALLKVVEVIPRPRCYILVGLPGSGKSTWVNNVFPPSGMVFSTDKIIEDICKEYKISYNDGWPTLIDFATKIYNRQIDKHLQECSYGGVDTPVVFDRTNLTKKSRKRIIERFKKDYEISVIEFKVDEEVRRARCAQRIGKTISDDIIEKMKSGYEPFTENEVLNAL